MTPTSPMPLSKPTFGLLILSLILACTACGSNRSNSKQFMAEFEVTLASVTGAPKIGAPIELSFSVKNGATKSARFCRYMTPIEGFYGDILEVKDIDGNKVPYQGILKKRAEPTADDYIDVTYGNSAKVTFDLQSVYPITTPGNYTIRFKGNKSLNRLADSNILLISVSN
jgi:hypothetical protein